MISGCSGGGKSTLLAQLGQRGFAVFEEAGRSVVKRELYSGGSGLPWRDIERFITLAAAEALAQYAEAASAERLAFLDRSVVEQACWLERHGHPVPPALAAFLADRPYHPTVFFAPPWPEIYVTDAERRHDFAAAVDEHDPLRPFYARLGYAVLDLPKASVEVRADFVLETLGRG